MRYFLKQYWRYIAMALAFATFNFLLSACEVKAENEIYTATLNYTQNVNTRENIIFTSNNGVLNDGGRGTLIFTLSTIERSTTSSFYTPTIQEITVNTGTDIYTCNVGTLSMTYNEEDNYKANVYSVVCEVNIGSQGIRQIKVKMQDGILNSYWINTSQYMTFAKNTDVGTQNILSAMQTMLNAYLGNINVSAATTADNTGTTNAYLQSIQSIMNSTITLITNGFLQNHTDLQTIIETITEQNKVCNQYDKNYTGIENKFIDSDGTERVNNTTNISEYIKIDKNTKIKVIQNTLWNYACFYNINKVKISCYNQNSVTVGDTITIPNNASYFRFSMEKSVNKPIYEICQNGNQAIADNQNEINKNITDSNTDGGQTQANDFFNNFDGGSTGSLMDIVNLPLDFLNSLNNTCQPIQITIPYFNETYNLPCLRSYLNGKFPTIVTLITLLVNGLLCYRVLKAFVDLVNKLKDPNNDDIEVMDL